MNIVKNDKNVYAFVTNFCVNAEDEKEKISEQVIDAMLDPKPDSMDSLPQSEVTQVELDTDQIADTRKSNSTGATDAAADADAKSKVETESSTEAEASPSDEKQSGR